MKYLQIQISFNQSAVTVSDRQHSNVDLVSDRVGPARGGCCPSDPGFRVKILGVVRPVRVSGSGCPRGVRPSDPPRNPPRSTLGIFLYMILYNISTNSI